MSGAVDELAEANFLLTTWLIVNSTNAVLIYSPCRHQLPKLGNEFAVVLD